MSENDTDIEFDFFEDEPPTEESSRAERLIPRRTPRGPQQPPRPPTNLTPLLRLIGLIAFAILIVVLLVFWVQSCQESSKDKTYKSYMGKVSDVDGLLAADRQAAQPGAARAGAEAGAARAAGLRARAARSSSTSSARRRSPRPGPLRDEHAALIQALQFRVSGLSGLASALAATANVKDATRAGTVLASQMQRLLASDVIWEDSFQAPSAAELDRQGVTGTNDAGGPLIPDSNFLQSSDLVTPTAMATVLSRIRGSASTPSTRRPARHEPRLGQGAAGRDGAEHVDADDRGRARRTCRFDVTVENSGDSQEANIPVTLTIIQAGVAHGR